MGTSEIPPEHPDEESPPTSAPAPERESTPAGATSWIRRRLVGTGGRRAPTTHFTVGQAAYVLGFHGVGSFVISGGVNFGIACAMYLSPDDRITLLRLPNTLAGDAALTIVIQVIVTWLIEWLAVTSDLRSGKVAPLAWRCGPKARWILGLPRTGEDGGETRGSSREGERDSSDNRHSTSNRKANAAPTRSPRMPLLAHPLRIIAVLVPSFILIWPPSIGILIALGTAMGDGDYLYPSRWTPQIFKLVFGAVLGLLTTPVMALFWVVREGVGGGLA